MLLYGLICKGSLLHKYSMKIIEIELQEDVPWSFALRECLELY